ncbi:MAG TPA: hypothetical protein VFE37_29160 [Chloroflexota bacterium]|nr:hypothetical protein [Chloroflexota bacterium]
MAVDPSAIQPGYSVYAHHVDPAHHADLGQFVGEVEAVLERGGLHYVQVGGGLQDANQLYLPIDAVRAVVGRQVHLNLSLEQLAGRAWHEPPR